MIQERGEEYLGVIYRLREDAETPVPLSELAGYFGFSPVSVHEMVQKLERQGWIAYHPYQGVRLTEAGEKAAQALLRRHRLWERFLTDLLDIPWDEAHTVAGRLEHVATELVTERLATFLGEPESCPHGGPIPPATEASLGQCLRNLEVGAEAQIRRIAPETPELLRRMAEHDLLPGCRVRVLDQGKDRIVVALAQTDEQVVISSKDAGSIWVEGLSL